MLEGNPAVQEIGSAAGKVICQVRIPPDWESARSIGEPLPTVVDDRRRFPRFHYRVRGLITPRPIFPSHTRPEQTFVVYTKDISRGGVALLHSQELFPKERCQLRLPPRFDNEFEVARCMRLTDQCYLIGARFPEPLDCSQLSSLVG